MEIQQLLKLVIEKKASDLHFTENEPPLLRIDGALQRTSGEPLSKDDLKRLIYSVLTDMQKTEFERELELDFSLALPELDRFRVNVHMQRGSVEAALRRIPLVIPTFESLRLPPIYEALARKPNGLVLVTGPTGVGKTTTLAAMVDLINREKEALIISIEDPIEFLHSNKKVLLSSARFFRIPSLLPAPCAIPCARTLMSSLWVKCGIWKLSLPLLPRQRPGIWF